jgi:hypothetical protein
MVPSSSGSSSPRRTLKIKAPRSIIIPGNAHPRAQLPSQRTSVCSSVTVSTSDLAACKLLVWYFTYWQWGLALIYHIWLDFTVMRWYCRDKRAVVRDLFSSCVWSVVCVCVRAGACVRGRVRVRVLSYEHILIYTNKIKFTFLPVSSLLCTGVSYHLVLHVWLSWNLWRN